MSQSTVSQTTVSQTTVSNDLTPQEESLADSSKLIGNEFDYRPVPVLACVTCFLGILSSIALFLDVGVVIAFAGGLLSIFAFRQQKKGVGVVGGKGLVWVGCLASLVFFCVGLTIHVHAFRSELPEGYVRVNFLRDISAKKLKQSRDGRFRIPKDIVENYVGKKIYIKGYMYQTRSLKDISSFVFLKDNGQCCMGGSPKPWDNMTVLMQGGKKVDAILNQLVAVSGTLRVNREAGEQESVYILEANQVEKAKTRY